jgi:hypothetical protein
VNKGTDNGILSAGSASNNVGFHLGERSARPYHGFHGNDFSPNFGFATNTYYHIVYSFVIGLVFQGF